MNKYCEFHRLTPSRVIALQKMACKIFILDFIAPKNYTGTDLRTMYKYCDIHGNRLTPSRVIALQKMTREKFKAPSGGHFGFDCTQKVYGPSYNEYILRISWRSVNSLASYRVTENDPRKIQGAFWRPFWNRLHPRKRRKNNVLEM